MVDVLNHCQSGGNACGWHRDIAWEVEATLGAWEVGWHVLLHALIRPSRALDVWLSAGCALSASPLRTPPITRAVLRLRETTTFCRDRCHPLANEMTNITKCPPSGRWYSLTGRSKVGIWQERSKGWRNMWHSDYWWCFRTCKPLTR